MTYKEQIKELEAEVERFALDSRNARTLIRDIAAAVGKAGHMDSIVLDEVQKLRAYRDEHCGSVPATIARLEQENKNLMYLLRCVHNDPTLKIENLSYQDLERKSRQRRDQEMRGEL